MDPAADGTSRPHAASYRSKGVLGLLPTSGPRYPAIRVRTRSPNPFALIAAVRYALWRARVEPAEIDRFTEAALT